MLPTNPFILSPFGWKRASSSARCELPLVRPRGRFAGATRTRFSRRVARAEERAVGPLPIGRGGTAGQFAMMGSGANRQATGWCVSRLTALESDVAHSTGAQVEARNPTRRIARELDEPRGRLER